MLSTAYSGVWGGGGRRLGSHGETWERAGGKIPGGLAHPIFSERGGTGRIKDGGLSGPIRADRREGALAGRCSHYRFSPIYPFY